MLLALAVTVLTASPDQGPVVVLVASKRAGAEAFTAKVATKVQQTLLANGTAGVLDDAAGAKLVKKAGGDARACQGGTECLAKTALLLGPKAVVIGVDVGKIAKTLAIHVEAVRAGANEPLAIADFSAPADTWAEQSAEPLTAFAKQLAEKLVAPETPPVAKADEIKRPADAPSDTSLVPPPQPSTTSPAVTASRSSSSGGGKIVPILAVGVAAAALITSGVLLGLGMSEKGVVDRSITGMNTELSKSEFDARRSRGNTYFTLSLSTALLGLVLGATGGVLFVL